MGKASVCPSVSLSACDFDTVAKRFVCDSTYWNTLQTAAELLSFCGNQLSFSHSFLVGVKIYNRNSCSY
jgi:hypothetical protein